ncbi:MAG TPA: PqiC family protein [Burkholderiaceae bacterium]|nr:PqiC family protein [Burkholderiaceae bacterium]
MKCLPIVHRAVLVALVLLAGACSSSPPVRYYTLGTGPVGEKSDAPSRPAGGYTVAVGPVAVPATVDRPQIVIQIDPNRVAMLDDQRWAEPLSSAISRTVASDLGKLLGVSTVLFPRDSMIDVKYRVAIEIRNFVSVPGEAATIDATWTVFGPKDAVTRGQRLAHETVTKADYEALAQAHTRALMSISRDVAASIASQEAAH